MLARLVFVLALAIAPCAAAQAPSVEAARAHADAVIARGEAGRWFTNITTSNQPTVRHTTSGMTCTFVGLDERDVIRVNNDESAGLTGAEDASCGTWIGRTYVTMFATRWPDRLTEEEAFSTAVSSLRRNWPQAVAEEGTFEIRLLEGQSNPRLAVFTVDLEGRSRRSVVIVRHIGEWSFKARATGPGDDLSAVEFGSLQFALSLPGGLEAAAAAGDAD